MRLIKFFISFAILVVFTMFATANLQQVHLNSLLKDKSLIGYTSPGEGGGESKPRELPVFLVVYFSFGLGFLVASIMSYSVASIHKRRLKDITKRFKRQEEELNKLRNLPVSDPGQLTDENLPELPLADHGGGPGE
jgi:hypothetical protein